MAEVGLKREIHDVLKEDYFKDTNDLVDVSDGPDDSIHVVVVSSVGWVATQLYSAWLNSST